MRIIPRDLYNEGNLLTNYGHLYIALELYNLQDLLVEDLYDDEQFNIVTDELSGATYLSNVKLFTQSSDELSLFRHLNSRETYSLWFVGEDDDYEVFTKSGKLTPNLLQAIGYIEG